MKKYIAVLLLTSLFACDLVVDVDIPIEKRQLVLNSFFTPDSVWKAKLTLSRHVLDDAPYLFVSDGEIVVYEGETNVATLHHDSLGFYRADTGTPEPGKNYSVRVNAPGYSTIESSSSCPTLIAAEFSDSRSTVDEFDQRALSFNITFNDNPGPNFYQVLVISEFRITHPSTGQGFINRNFPHTWTDDPGIDGFDGSEGFFFSDVLFDGKEFSVNVKVTEVNYWNNGSPVTVKYFVYFRSLSEEYYKYKVTSKLQDYASGDPFAQPVKVYNNIQNGFGVFAGYSQTVKIYEK